MLSYQTFDVETTKLFDGACGCSDPQRLRLPKLFNLRSDPIER
jgi:hypothetical protein